MVEPKVKRGSMRTRSAPTSPRVLVCITKETIEEAEQSNSRHCMISDQIVKTIPSAVNVITDTSTIRWTDPDLGLRYVYLTPINVREAIMDFDDGIHVKPFRFELRHAHVLAAHWHGGVTQRMSLDSWRKLRLKADNLRKKNRLKYLEWATEIGIKPGTLRNIFSRENQIPSAFSSDAIEAWVLKQTGEAPAPRVDSKAKSVSGPTQIRMLGRTKHSAPHLVGGNAPPVGSGMREFGLRKFRRRINTTA